MALAPGATRERDLSWLDWSQPLGLSNDGKTVLISEQGMAGDAVTPRTSARQTARPP